LPNQGKRADLNRSFVVCALVSDLYCPGYDPKQSLANDSNLARTAIRYKIDVGRVAAAVRAELTKNKKNERRRDKDQDFAGDPVRTTRTDKSENNQVEQTG
jgi:hypothetical protein